jgi:hypothetical protein
LSDNEKIAIENTPQEKFMTIFDVKLVIGKLKKCRINGLRKHDKNSIGINIKFKASEIL